MDFVLLGSATNPPDPIALSIHAPSELFSATTPNLDFSEFRLGNPLTCRLVNSVVPVFISLQRGSLMKFGCAQCFEHNVLFVFASE